MLVLASLPFQKSLESCRKYINSDHAPMHVVGRFLGTVFNNHSLPKRCGEGLSRPRSVSRLSFSPEPSQLLHYCPGYSQAQLIRLIVSIYDGVPEAFEVFHCRPSSTEEELGLFLKRAAKHPLQYLVLEVNRLPFKLQEVHECLTISPHDCDSPCLSPLSPSLLLPPSLSLPLFLPPSVSDAASSGDPAEGEARERSRNVIKGSLPALC